MSPFARLRAVGLHRQPAASRIVIIGAGPTGLGAAWRLDERHHADFLVLESASHPGGLASSPRDRAGFTWDLGGHVQFSHYRYYDDALDRVLGEWYRHRRDAAIRIGGVDVPYPLQHHVESLPAPWPDRVRQEPPGEPPPAGATFDAWLHATFGGALCAAFFVPYNQKIWQHPLHDMQSAWVGDRVAAPQRPAGDQRWGPNATFRYPASGGTGAIWSAMAARLPASRVCYGAHVACIDAQRRQVQMTDGTSHDYDVLVSTMPLDALASAMRDVPAEVIDASRQLAANSVELVGIGVRARVPERLRQHSWRYFPEPASPYYRVTVLSNYSPAMVPDAGCYSLLTEGSHPRGTAADVPGLVAQTVRALEHDGLIDRDASIVSTWHHTLARGYPVPTLGRDAALATIHAALHPLGIFSRGRFGGWKYEVSNQDHSFMQGVELIDALLDGTPEVTYCDPDRANSGVFLAGPAATARP